MTPHVLSEWMVEVCAGDKYVFNYVVFRVWSLAVEDLDGYRFMFGISCWC